MNTKCILFGAVTSAVLFIACDEAPKEVLTGDLQVSYQVGSGARSCEEAGIASIRVYLTVADSSEAADRLFACDADNQTITLEDVEVGSYAVSAEGLDGENNVIYVGEAPEEVTVEADQTNGPVRVSFDQVRPAMEIFFDFDGAGGCDRFEVTNIVVVVYQDGVSNIHEESYICADQLNAPLEIKNLAASSSYDLRVRGTNENGEYTYEYNEDDIAVTPGPPTEVSAVMVKCTTLCDAPS